MSNSLPPAAEPRRRQRRRGIGAAGIVVVGLLAVERLRGRHHRIVHVGEARLLLEETQVDVAHGAITMLGDDDLSHAGRGHAVFVLVDAIILRTVDESYDVGVLLDGARLAQVRKLGTLRTAAHLRGAAQLRQGDDRHVELLGDGLERTRYESHLLLAVALRILVAGHELEVVDDDDLDVVMDLQTPRLGAELEDRKSRRIVDEQRCGAQRLGSRFKMAPLLGRETARLDIIAAQSRLGDDQTHHQLHGRHFEREESHAGLVVDGHVAGHGEHESRLTHRRTGRDDDQVRKLPAERHAVDGHEARRHAVVGAGVLRRLLDLHQRTSQNVLGRLHRTLDMALGNLENLALGISDQFRDVGRLVVRTTLNLRGGADQLALHVFLGDDLGVELDVGRRTHLLRELGQVGRAAYLLELLLDLEPFGHGVEVDGLELHRQLLDRLVDQTVLLGVERLGRDELLHGDDAVLFEHQSAQDRLFQLDRLRGHVAGRVGQRVVGFAVAPRGGEILGHFVMGCFKGSKLAIRADISKAGAK